MARHSGVDFFLFLKFLKKKSNMRVFFLTGVLSFFFHLFCCDLALLTLRTKFIFKNLMYMGFF